MATRLLITPVSRVHATAQTLYKAAVATLAVLLLIPLMQIAATTISSVSEQVATTADTISTPVEDAIVPVATAPLTYTGERWAAISDDGGVAVATAGGAFDLRTTSIAGAEVSTVESVRDGELLTFDHGIATEWWRTVDNGLEQGWTFDSAPAGTDGVLTVDVSVSGSVTPVIESDTVVRLTGDGQTLWYRDLASWDATGRDLQSTMSIVDGQIRITVDATGAVYPVTIDPILTEDQKIEPPDGTAQDGTGTAVDISGPNAVVTIPGEDVVGRNAGRAVFYRDNGAGVWNFSQATNGGLGGDAGYGDAVALAYDFNSPAADRAIALIAAPQSDLNGVDSGAVEVYSYDPAIPGGWQLVTNIYACDQPSPGCDIKVVNNNAAVAGALFGSSIDLQHIGGSSWLAAIGAPGIEQVHYVDFDMTASGRTLATGFDADLREILSPTDAGGVPFSSPGFGSDVDMRWGPDDAFSSTETDQYYVVGTGTNAFPDADADAAYVYQRQPGGAAPVLVEQIPTFGIGFGRVAVANDMVAVADDARFGGGEIRVYTGAFSGSPFDANAAWTLSGGSTAKFGASLEFADVDGDQTVLAFGAPGLNKTGDPNRTGRAFLYEITKSDPGGTTTQLPEIADPTISAQQEGAAMGTSIATDGTNWMVGAPNASELIGGVGQATGDGEAQIGAVRQSGVTDLTVDDGPPVALPRFANPQLDRFGSSIDIDGDRMVVGAPDRDSTWEQGGAVFVYDRDGAGVWNLSATINAPGPNVGFFDPIDGFGIDVAIEGNFIVVGATDHSFFAPIFAYELVAGTWEIRFVSPSGGLSTNFGETVEILTHPATGTVTMYVGGSDGVPADAVDGQVRKFEYDGISDFVEAQVTTGGDSFGTAIDAVVEPGSTNVVVLIGAPDDGGGSGAVYRYIDSGGGAGLELDGSYDEATAAGNLGQAVAIDPDTGTMATVEPELGQVILLKDANPGAPANTPLTVSQSQAIAPFDATFGPEANGTVAVRGNFVVTPTAGAGLEVTVAEPSGVGFAEVDRLITTDQTAGDQLGWDIVWADDNTIALGAPGDDGPISNIEPDAGAVYIYNYVLPADDPTLNFTFDLAPGSVPTVELAGGISAAQFDSKTIAALTESETSIGAAPLNAVELADTPLNAVAGDGSALGSVDLSTYGLIDIIAGSSDLQALSLVEISIAGGWESIIAGTPLADQPINNLTLGDLLDGGAAESGLSATRLGEIDISDTPLNAVPLNAVALGALPLNAVPLNAVGESVASVCGSIPGCDGNTTVLEASLRGAPLNAVPLNAVPLNAVDVGATPLNAVPLNAVDLAQSPLNAVPLNAVAAGLGGSLAGTPLNAVPLNAVPLNAVPLNAVPLNAVDVAGTPLNAVPLNAVPLNAVPLNAVPLNAVPLNAVPLNAVGLDATPLNAVPLNAVVLADLPLNAVPLNAVGTAADDWCDLLADVGGGFDCGDSVADPTDGQVDPAETTIFDLMVQGVPLNAVPLNAVPLNAVTVDGTPLNAVPLNAVPLNAVPLNAVPLNAVPLNAVPLNAVTVGGTPLNAVPLNAVDILGSPLNAVPLNAVPLNAVPLNAVPLNAVPLNAVPLNAVPLNAVTVGGTPLNAVPLNAVDITGSPLNAVPLNAVPLNAVDSFVDCTLIDCDVATLGDAIVAGAADALLAQNFDELEGALFGIRYSELEAALGGAIDFGASTVADITDASELTLGDLVVDHPGFDATTLGDLEAALYAVTFADVAEALGTTPAALDAAFDAYVATVAPTPTLDDLESYGDVTLGDLLSDGDLGLTMEDLGRILGLVNVEDLLAAFDPDATIPTAAVVLAQTLGSLSPEELGDLTLFDLIGIVDFDTLTLEELYDLLFDSGTLDGYTFGDLLIALVDAGELPYDGLNFADVDSGALPAGVVPDVSFQATVELTDTTADYGVEVSVDMPSTASYVPGTTTATGIAGDLGDPMVVGNRLAWTIPQVAPATPVAITFTVRPEVGLGSTELDATARIVGFDDLASGAATVAVAEGLEPNDYPATVAAAEGTVYLTYITDSQDNDVFEIAIADNDQLFVELSSLDADLDLALYVKPTDPSAVAPLADVSNEAPLIPIEDPDQEGADAEPLQDFRRLDQDFPLDGLELVEVSNSAGTETETIGTGRLIAGTYYVQVFGANGATTTDPAVLQFDIVEAEDADPCAALNPVAATPSATPTVAGTPNTAILVNYQRIEQLHSAQDRTDVQTAVDNFVNYLNGPGAGLGIDPLVIPVDGFADVRTAYTAWDTDVNQACDPVAANAIVDAIITNAIDPIRDSLDHVMILGDDALIPMARLADETTVANEYDYRHEFDDDGAEGVGTTNAFTSTFWNRVYLSDEPYGESAARDLGDRFLYISDLALGRLVETPDEIIAQLQTFQTFNGELDITTGEVLGYDFLSDGSAEIAADLTAGLAGAVDDSLADGEVSPGVPWTATEAEDALTTGASDILSLNAHFDHYRALPADEGVLLETSNVLTGISVDIIFSMGCHGGLTVSDVQVGNTNQDWAQVFAQNQSVFIGNTGFGYGDTETVAYTERLMALFAEEVVRPFGAGADKTSIGQALTFAKNRFVSDLASFSVYDEKAVMESTFYGIPFYTVGIAGEPLPPAPTNTTTPDATGLETLGQTITPANDAQATGIGTYYSNPDTDGDDEQVIAVPGYPVQPSLSTDISVVGDPDSSVLAQVARGAIVTGMTSQYLPGTDPVVAGAIFDEVAAEQGEPELGDVVFPAKPVTINTATTPGGERQTLVTATGQFASAGLTQRLDSDVDVVVYYADPADADFTPPTIGTVESTLDGTQFTVTLDVTDDEGAIERVLVLVVEDPGTGTHDWIPVELQQIGGTNQWSGSATVTASEVEFLVQAVDGSGNVGFATNKARNFNDDLIPDPEPPTPDVDAVENSTNLDAGTGWYTGDATVDVTVTNGQAEYSVDGSAYQPLVGSSFQITGDGIHTWSVRLTSGDQEIDGIVRIDTTGAPVIEIAPPADGAVYDEDSVPTLSYLCSDPSLQGSCDVTINGAPAALGDQLPTATGVTHTVTVSGTDVFGNANSATHTYTVQAAGNAPVIIDGMVENIAAPGEMTDVVVEFTGDPGVTASIDWGDGTVTTGTVTDPTGTSPGIAEGSHTYAAGGVYTITVTLTSPGGSASIDLATASCTKIGTPGNDVINGTTGDDVLCGLGGNDRINGLAGNDIIFGGNGRDVLYGNSGIDIIFGGRARDIIYGGGQDDLLIGGWGNDYLNGQAGNDVLQGRAGPDALIGGSGDDELYGQRGNDYISGQSGDDFARGGRGADRLYGSGGDDELRGGAGNDRIYGGWDADNLSGGTGDDIIYGQAGPDEINGGADDDFCRGGGGANTLINCEQ